MFLGRLLRPYTIHEVSSSLKRSDWLKCNNVLGHSGKSSVW